VASGAREAYGRAMGESVPWQGLNHLALITTDMDATVRFWHGVLGAPLVATIGTETFRHYFFGVGPGSTVAFFEYTGVELESFAKPAGIPDPRAVQFDHLALDLADEATLLDLRARLTEHGSEVTDVVDHGLMRSIYFNDPNGIALEASWWADDPTALAEDDSGRFTDPNPVPAAQEALAAGPLTGLPRTRLVDAPVTGLDTVWDGAGEARKPLVTGGGAG
jgi:catechol 2,3-dioxygenase-like lactoylglutathione lyase family enzyme